MSTTRPILIVENDDGLRELLVSHLAASGEFGLIAVSTLYAAVQRLGVDDVPFDSILVDIKLPDGNGIEFCSNLRRQGHEFPIIILGNASADADVIRGLDAGANDYITDTTRVNELLARLRAQLRLFDTSVNAVFTIGSYRFRPSAKLLVNSRTNYRICLTNKEVDLLKFLYRTGGCFVPRQILMSKVWGYEPDAPSMTLDTHISSLRRKMAADPNNYIRLIAMPGGYRLTSEWQPTDVDNYA